jgi:serine/threonine-protein kinase RsbW
VPELVRAVIYAMRRLGYGATDRLAVGTALEEATLNALTHGHRGDPGKHVRIAWDIMPAKVTLVVLDEGPGFDTTRVPDPRLPDNRDRPRGRGLLLIRAFMSWVRFNCQGNGITMYRHRSLAAH